MADNHELESIYREAQSALKAKDFNRAGDLLRQILVVDENYRDVSRLLAQTVKLRRRRWYNHPLLWSAIGAVGLVWIALLLAPRVQAIYARQTVPSANIPAITSTPNITQVPTVSPTPTVVSTPVPLAWKRISMGQEFPRDAISAIVIDPKDADVIYFGTQNAGIYRSIDGGISWQPVQNGLGGTQIGSLVMDPQNPQTLYAGVVLGGVYKTTDGGNHWVPKNNGINQSGGGMISVVSIYPKDSRQLYFSPKDYLYSSQDGGETWVETRSEKTTDCPRNILRLVVDSVDPLKLLAFNSGGSGCSSGIYESLDGGKSWVSPRQVDSRNDPTTLVADKTGETVYTANAEGAYISKDRGETWRKLPGYGCDVLALDPSGSSTIYCALSNKILVSTDSGENWQDFALMDHPVEAITVSPHSSQIVLVGSQGLWITKDDGKTWSSMNNGMGGNEVELKISPADPTTLYAQGIDHTLYLSKDTGKSWGSYGSGQTLSIDNSGRYSYALNDGLAISSNNGNSWKIKALPVPNGDPDGIAVNPADPNKVFALYPSGDSKGFPFIFHSDDMGATWQGTIGIQEIDNSRLFFAHNLGKTVYAIGIMDSYQSEDNGITWQNCGHLPNWDDSWGMSSNSDTRAAVDPRDSNRLFVATSGAGISISDDGCKNWQLSNSGLESLFVNTVALDLNNPDVVYVGTGGGAYISFNSGKTWNQINEGLLGATVVYSIVVDKDSNVYATTPYGVFKLEKK